MRLTQRRVTDAVCSFVKEGAMKHASKRRLLLAVLALFAVALAPAGSGPLGSALAQPSPVPQECVCSPGVNIGSTGAPVIIRHCQCGILSCAVIVGSGQLQCTR